MAHVDGKESEGIVALLPAAGHGKRMGSHIPKQYLLLNERSVLECTWQRLLAVPAVTSVIVVVAPADVDNDLLDHPSVRVTIGGDSRAESVHNGLLYIRDKLQHKGNVLVHDAARPCVRVADIIRLISEVGSSPHGGILAIPASDTLKLSDSSGRIIRTVDRTNMWRAATPQLFRIDCLIKALDHAKATENEVTDEASAMESAGYQPRLVNCAPDNIKITVAEDMALARSILSAQEQV